MKFVTYNANNAVEIERLFVKTFSDSEGRSEGELIGGLVKDFMHNTDAGDFNCFVAVENEQIIGGIFFSRVTFEKDMSAFIMAPVAIHPDYQGKGIGRKLINFGLDTLREDGVKLALTYGDPNFYTKVGFRVVTEEQVPPPLTLQYPHGWLAQSLTGDKIEPIAGKSICVKALDKPEYW